MNLRKEGVLSAKRWSLQKERESRHRKHKNGLLSVCKGREKRRVSQALRLQKSRESEKTVIKVVSRLLYQNP